ncbi:Pup--protein ligase [Corynebacterium yudongzhengii]|uniref:Pup--protein ligase n=1 Tax=Corynebacterium yudongzhengii TaxID=2080740 RepID=A0A2U1T8N7_9CORY|nr:Pup--protein ligase [Corynebacterium yudongzhengii]AWB82975.1 Pup--protein ligase [Corynebacterium yudongzhengii]PWC02366.1 Pup--protein ligase [Corynebacterium yudongzhengii]
MGVETEYGITGKLSPDDTARYLFRPLVERYSSTNIFTRNASRLYLDVGAHPEVATGECDTLGQLVRHERAGDHMLNELAIKAEQALSDDNIGGNVYLFKNNVDSVGNSYGCHENYLIGRDMVLKALGKQLLPFMITRQLIAGAGLLRDGEFLLSQRADQVWEGISSATTRARPIINTRDEPHGDSTRFRRMHVIVGDSNMSETTFVLKIGATQLALEMLEAGYDLPDFELDNAIAHIRDISRDQTGSTELKLKSGGVVTALEVQRAFCSHARTWLDEREPDPDMDYVVDLWERTLDAIETQDFSQVDTEIDWVIKKKLLERYAGRADDAKLAQIDLAYHDIREDRGLFHVLCKRGLARRLTTDEEIAQAVKTAPETTRAHLRGRVLNAADKYGAEVTVDWVNIKYGQERIELQDPFATVDERVDELITRLEADRGE